MHKPNNKPPDENQSINSLFETIYPKFSKSLTQNRFSDSVLNVEKEVVIQTLAAVEYFCRLRKSRYAFTTDPLTHLLVTRKGTPMPASDNPEEMEKSVKLSKTILSRAESCGLLSGEEKLLFLNSLNYLQDFRPKSQKKYKTCSKAAAFADRFYENFYSFQSYPSDIFTSVKYHVHRDGVLTTPQLAFSQPFDLVTKEELKSLEQSKHRNIHNYLANAHSFREPRFNLYDIDIPYSYHRHTEDTLSMNYTEYHTDYYLPCFTKARYPAANSEKCVVINDRVFIATFDLFALRGQDIARSIYSAPLLCYYKDEKAQNLCLTTNHATVSSIEEGAGGTIGALSFEDACILIKDPCFPKRSIEPLSHLAPRQINYIPHYFKHYNDCVIVLAERAVLSPSYDGSNFTLEQSLEKEYILQFIFPKRSRRITETSILKTILHTDLSTGETLSKPRRMTSFDQAIQDCLSIYRLEVVICRTPYTEYFGRAPIFDISIRTGIIHAYLALKNNLLSHVVCDPDLEMIDVTNTLLSNPLLTPSSYLSDITLSTIDPFKIFFIHTETSFITDEEYSSAPTPHDPTAHIIDTSGPIDIYEETKPLTIKSHLCSYNFKTSRLQVVDLFDAEHDELYVIRQNHNEELILATGMLTANLSMPALVTFLSTKKTFAPLYFMKAIHITIGADFQWAANKDSSIIVQAVNRTELINIDFFSISTSAMSHLWSTILPLPEEFTESSNRKLPVVFSSCVVGDDYYISLGGHSIYKAKVNAAPEAIVTLPKKAIKSFEVFEDGASISVLCIGEDPLIFRSF